MVILCVGRYSDSGNTLGRCFRGSGNIEICRYMVSGNIVCRYV